MLQYPFIHLKVYVYLVQGKLLKGIGVWINIGQVSYFPLKYLSTNELIFIMIQNMKKVLVAFVLLTLKYTSFGCSCGPYIHEFCNSVYSDSYIVLVEISEIQDGSSATFKLIEDIHNTIAKDRISVLGQDGLNCGISFGQFKVGDTLVVNVSNFNIIHAKTGVLFDWYLPDCTRRFLRYSNNVVSGGTVGGQMSQNYDHFKTNINDCIQFTSGIHNMDKNFLEIYPNPTPDNLIIEANENRINDIELFDIHSKLVLKHFGDNNNIHILNLSTLNAGVYFMVVHSNFGIIRKRIIKLSK